MLIFEQIFLLKKILVSSPSFILHCEKPWVQNVESPEKIAAGCLVHAFTQWVIFTWAQRVVCVCVLYHHHDHNDAVNNKQKNPE